MTGLAARDGVCAVGSQPTLSPSPASSMSALVALTPTVVNWALRGISKARGIGTVDRNAGPVMAGLATVLAQQSPKV